MKIRNEHISALPQESEARRNTQVTEKGFNALLNTQLGAGQAQGVAPAMDSRLTSSQGGLSAGLVETQGGTVPPVSSVLTGNAQEVADRMDGMLNSFEQYATELSSDDDDALRTAYSLLQDMTNHVSSLRSAFPDMKTEQPELAAMVNELEVLTTTETFKFNRGDYL